jgi:hypothetical protein
MAQSEFNELSLYERVNKPIQNAVQESVSKLTSDIYEKWTSNPGMRFMVGIPSIKSNGKATITPIIKKSVIDTTEVGVPEVANIVKDRTKDWSTIEQLSKLCTEVALLSNQEDNTIDVHESEVIESDDILSWFKDQVHTLRDNMKTSFAEKLVRDWHTKHVHTLVRRFGNEFHTDQNTDWKQLLGKCLYLSEIVPVDISQVTENMVASHTTEDIKPIYTEWLLQNIVSCWVMILTSRNQKIVDEISRPSMHDTVSNLDRWNINDT